MKTLMTTLALLAAASAANAATLPIRNGAIELDLNGGTGSNAGSVALNLSYADAAKTQVKIEGAGKGADGRAFTVSQVNTLAQLQKLVIYAAGGAGYDGSDGRSGWDGSDGRDGSDGWNGSDGCPPGNGQNGGDGTDGGDGGNGGDGTDGGNGGNGGQVRVTAPADQSELLLLVKFTVEGGRGGEGGIGGRGGSGGRGGRAGQGGRGGSNTCRDSAGNPTHGPDGSSGWDGRSGRSGDSGRSGSNGSDGYAGRNGAMTFVAGTAEYARPFKLTINSVKAIDDNEDSVVEPGEAVHVTEIVIANSGPMPTPTSQALSLVFGNSATLVARTAPAQLIPDVIPGNSTRTLTFPKGTLVFAAPDKAELVGKDTLLATTIAINSFKIGSADGTGLGIHWPVGISAASNATGTYFGTAKALSYTIKNVSSREVGPSGVQPVDVEFAWVSTAVPGADVTAVLADGRQFKLDQPYVVSDFTIAAKGSLAVPVTVTVKNSKGLLTSNGTFKVTLKLRDMSTPNMEKVDASTTTVALAADYRPVAINRKIDLTALNIYCKFPKRLLQTLHIVELDLTKRAGTDKVTMGILRKGFLSDGTSPNHDVGTFDFAPYGSLTRTVNAGVVVNLLNRLFAPRTTGDEFTWQMEAGACGVRQQHVQ